MTEHHDTAPVLTVMIRASILSTRLFQHLSGDLVLLSVVMTITTQCLPLRAMFYAHLQLSCLHIWFHEIMMQQYLSVIVISSSTGFVDSQHFSSALLSLFFKHMVTKMEAQ